MKAPSASGGQAPKTTPGDDPDDSLEAPALAERAAEATLACPHVLALSGGMVSEVATYLPGRRVTGVRVRDTEVDVHVVARYGPTMDEIGAQVRAALTPLVGARTVTVTIDDLGIDLRRGSPHGPASLP